MANARVQRGRESEELAARWFRENGWPDAQRRPASLPGCDIMGMPGLLPEVKARRSLDLTGWLKQAAHREGGVPFLVVRPDGYGEARLHDWPVIFRLGDATRLLQQAGFAHHSQEPTR